jgi:hypothetical protein
MSGSGGGGPDFTPSPEVDCEGLAFEAAIASPQPAAVSGLSVGDVLIVDFDTSGGRNTVLLRTSQGDEAGALISRLAELLRCLQQGESYEAEIADIDGGDITVNVRHT